MDLSFARRNVPAPGQATKAKALSGLLAQAAARQATTPTARAQFQASASEIASFSIHCEVSAFAGRELHEATDTEVSSFNPGVAATILTLCKPS